MQVLASSSEQKLASAFVAFPVWGSQLRSSKGLQWCPLYWFQKLSSVAPDSLRRRPHPGSKRTEGPGWWSTRVRGNILGFWVWSITRKSSYMTIVIGQRSQDLTKDKQKLNLSSNPEAELIRELLKIGLRLWCLCCISSRRWAGFSEHCYQTVAPPGTLSMLLNTGLSILHMPPLLPSFNGHLKCGFTPILAQPAQKSMRLPALSSLQLSGFSTRTQAWVSRRDRDTRRQRRSRRPIAADEATCFMESKPKSAALPLCMP